MSKFLVEHAVKDGWTRWVQPIRKGYKMVCCDCGLVHDMNSRVKNGRVQFQMKRNNRSTALTRRWDRKRAETLRLNDAANQEKP